MKKLLVLGFLIMAMTLSSYTCWEENGKSIRQETNLNYSSAVIKLSSGDFMMMWSDASSGTQKMKLQKVSEDGENFWEEPVILSERELYYANGESLVETSDGYIVAVWYELDNPNLIRCQKLDTEGNLLWGEDGLIFEMNFHVSYCLNTKVIADLNGGVFITLMRRNVITLNITADGTIAEGWSDNGNLIFIASQFITSYSCLPDVIGGIVILAHNYRDNHYYLQRCNDQGAILWSQLGIDAGDYDEMEIINWDYGEFALVSYNYDELQIKANVIDLGGNFLYPEPQPVAEISEDTWDFSYKAVITGDNKLGMIYSGPNLSGLLAQKTDIGLTPEWGAEGVLISDDDYYFIYQFANLIPDNAGGLHVFWYESDDISINLFMGHINTDGSIDLDNIPISSMDNSPYESPVLYNNSAEETTIFWRELSDGDDKIKIQIADTYGNMLLPENGNSIWQEQGGSVNWDVTDIDSNGEYSLICWAESSTYNSYYTIYIQVFDNATGEYIFPDQGLAVSDYSSCRQEYPVAIFNETGDKICIAYEQRYTEPEAEGAIIQIMDLEGNRLLGNNGYILSSDNMEVEVEGIAVSSQGDDFIVFWNDFETESGEHLKTLNVQKFVDCQPVWDDPTLLSAFGMNDFTGVSISNNYLIWQETTFGSDCKLKVARLTEAGEIEDNWGEEGIEIAAENHITDCQSYITDDGIVVIWREINDQKAQYISATGDLLWGDEGYFFENEELQLADAQVIEDKLIGLFKDFPSQSFKFIEFDLDGSNGWNEPEVLNIMEIDAYSSSITMDIWEDLIIVYWSDIGYYNIYALIYDLEGNLIENIPPDGISICSERHEQYCRSSIVDDSGSSFVIWQDARGSFMPASDPSIYVQKIDLNTVPTFDDEIIDGNVVNVSNYPNPFTKSTTLKCDLPRNAEDAEIVIYNIKGQKVRSLPATSNEVEWDCRNQAGKLAGSGVYFYVLQGKNIKSETGKMIMLR